MIGTNRFVGGALAAALLAAVAWLGMSNFEGNPYAFLLFYLSFLAMAALTLPRPRLYSYTFVAAMLFLGFWMKVVIHLIFDTAFLELIGTFDGTPQSWNRALTYASMAALGACSARALHLLYARRRARSSDHEESPASTTPTWYGQLRTPLWAGSFFMLFLFNALNFKFAFYQIGVNPKLILPIHLNVLAAWLINVGFAFWFACLIHWDFARSREGLANNLLAPILEALVSSISALSRSFYILHTVPYFLALGENWARVRGPLPRRLRASLVVFWALCFALSLTTVSWLRIQIYYLGSAPTYFSISKQKGSVDHVTPGATMENQIRPMVQQVSNLIIGRWIGLEGVLAVAAYKDKSMGLFLDALRENPKQGNESIYQQIAKSQYRASETFTFLTLPGSVAVLAYSDSLLVVLIGFALMVLVTIATEIAGMRLTSNSFLVSVMGCAMANVVCQTNFPYLSLVFFVQLWVALLFIWQLQRYGRSSPTSG